MTPSRTTHFDRLVDEVSTDGLLAHEAAVSTLVEYARERDLAPVLVGILGDRLEPEVARLRALARIVEVLETERPFTPISPTPIQPARVQGRPSLVCATA